MTAMTHNHPHVHPTADITVEAPSGPPRVSDAELGLAALLVGLLVLLTTILVPLVA